VAARDDVKENQIQMWVTHVKPYYIALVDVETKLADVMLLAAVDILSNGD